MLSFNEKDRGVTPRNEIWHGSHPSLLKVFLLCYDFNPIQLPVEKVIPDPLDRR